MIQNDSAAIAAAKGGTSAIFVPAQSLRPPLPGEVLCQTLEIGVCGTDREVLASAQPFTPPTEQHLILGHECVARVLECGPETPGFAPGDLVTPVVRRAKEANIARPDMLAFGRYTERGIVEEHGFAQPRFVDRAEHLLPVSVEIREIAVLAEPLSVAEKAINEAVVIQKARLDQADYKPRVLVTGMGPIGFAALVACRLRNWETTLFGRDEHDSFRAQTAISFGARYWNERQCLAPADVEREGFDLILECTGSDHVMLRATESLAARGVAVWLGSSRRPQSKPHNVALLMRNAVVRNHVLLGTVNAAPRDFRQALTDLEQLQKTHPVETRALLTERIAPRDALWHYENRRPQAIKTVVVFGE